MISVMSCLCVYVVCEADSNDTDASDDAGVMLRRLLCCQGVPCSACVTDVQ